ncbi:hypothetical protein BJ875DRAFT_495681 [Amylocarpus encephaloides]|uniref:Uncharacterized protein n=1 Tax=Amylocarpus encephaloides TaxID=45428 RepID=A0A9P7YIQ9_9HELO|nr:hypothetical protein BJ875DRAFT_495681 [Amylocarpus encephaloides]
MDQSKGNEQSKQNPTTQKEKNAKKKNKNKNKKGKKNNQPDPIETQPDNSIQEDESRHEPGQSSRQSEANNPDEDDGNTPTKKKEAPPIRDDDPSPTKKGKEIPVQDDDPTPRKKKKETRSRDEERPVIRENELLASSCSSEGDLDNDDGADSPATTALSPSAIGSISRSRKGTNIRQQPKLNKEQTRATESAAREAGAGSHGTPQPLKMHIPEQSVTATSVPTPDRATAIAEPLSTDAQKLTTFSVDLSKFSTTFSTPSTDGKFDDGTTVNVPPEIADLYITNLLSSRRDRRTAGKGPRKAGEKEKEQAAETPSDDASQDESVTPSPGGSREVPATKPSKITPDASIGHPHAGKEFTSYVPSPLSGASKVSSAITEGGKALPEDTLDSPKPSRQVSEGDQADGEETESGKEKEDGGDAVKKSTPKSSTGLEQAGEELASEQERKKRKTSPNSQIESELGEFEPGSLSTQEVEFTSDNSKPRSPAIQRPSSNKGKDKAESLSRDLRPSQRSDAPVDDGQEAPPATPQPEMIPKASKPQSSATRRQSSHQGNEKALSPPGDELTSQPSAVEGPFNASGFSNSQETAWTPRWTKEQEAVRSRDLKEEAEKRRQAMFKPTPSEDSRSTESNEMMDLVSFPVPPIRAVDPNRKKKKIFLSAQKRQYLGDDGRASLGILNSPILGLRDDAILTPTAAERRQRRTEGAQGETAGSLDSLGEPEETVFTEWQAYREGNRDSLAVRLAERVISASNDQATELIGVNIQHVAVIDELRKLFEELVNEQPEALNSVPELISNYRTSLSDERQEIEEAKERINELEGHLERERNATVDLKNQLWAARTTAAPIEEIDDPAGAGESDLISARREDIQLADQEERIWEAVITEEENQMLREFHAIQLREQELQEFEGQVERVREVERLRNERDKQKREAKMKEQARGELMESSRNLEIQRRQLEQENKELQRIEKARDEEIADLKQSEKEKEETIHRMAGLANNIQHYRDWATRTAIENQALEAELRAKEPIIRGTTKYGKATPEGLYLALVRVEAALKLMRKQREKHGIIPGDADIAISISTDALKMAREHNHAEGKGRAYFWKAIANWNGGRLKSAKTAMKRSKEYAAHLRSIEGRRECRWVDVWLEKMEHGGGPAAVYQKEAEEENTLDEGTGGSNIPGPSAGASAGRSGGLFSENFIQPPIVAPPSVMVNLEGELGRTSFDDGFGRASLDESAGRYSFAFDENLFQALRGMATTDARPSSTESQNARRESEGGRRSKGRGRAVDEDNTPTNSRLSTASENARPKSKGKGRAVDQDKSEVEAGGRKGSNPDGHFADDYDGFSYKIHP